MQSVSDMEKQARLEAAIAYNRELVDLYADRLNDACNREIDARLGVDTMLVNPKN